MMHVEGNLFVGRTEDGGVRIIRLKDHDLAPAQWPDANDVCSMETELDMVLTSESWASVVSSVSKNGETGETWQKALDFHNTGN